MYYLGFDIGGTSVKSVLVQDKKVMRASIDNLPKNFNGLVNFLSRKIDDYGAEIKNAKIGGVGLAIPGPLNSERTKILRIPNISYLNRRPLKRILERKIKIPTLLEHDAHAFLLAEMELGAAKRAKNIFLITIGTGLGAAFTVDGKIVKGAHGAGGEIGHAVLQIKTGNRRPTAEFEELTSNKFIKKNLKMDSVEAWRKALKGNKKAKRVWSELGCNLGIVLANIINIFDPEMIILAGGITEARRLFETQAKKMVKKLIISPDAQNAKILFSKLNILGGAIGAALLFQK